MIAGYVTRTSVRSGDSVAVHVGGAVATRYVMRIYRLGWYGGAGARRIACVRRCRELDSPAETISGVLTPRWPVAARFRVGRTWTSGYYLVQLRIAAGPYRGRGSVVPLIVRETGPHESAILVQVPTNTWQAYNAWGGRSNYPFNSAGGKWTGVVPLVRPLQYTGSTLFSWEYPLVRYLERIHADVAYATDADIDRDPGELLRHRLIMIAGHDEYWTLRMRQGFDRAQSLGTNIALMGANAGYWRVSYSRDRQTMISPKAPSDRFRAEPVPGPECRLFGVQFMGGTDTSGRIGYTVAPGAAHDPWLLRTRLLDGQTLPGLVGYEWDSPVPACTPAPVKTLFQHTGSAASAAAVRFTAASGARVFAAGSLQFNWGLDGWDGPGMNWARPSDRGIPALKRFMARVIADLTRPAPPLALHARRARGHVILHVEVHRDPRRLGIVVLRWRAGKPAVVVCRGSALTCVDRLSADGTSAYTAQVVDRWGASQPVRVTVG